jgi:hypothetical protein
MLVSSGLEREPAGGFALSAALSVLAFALISRLVSFFLRGGSFFLEPVELAKLALLDLLLADKKEASPEEE